MRFLHIGLLLDLHPDCPICRSISLPQPKTYASRSLLQPKPATSSYRISARKHANVSINSASRQISLLCFAKWTHTSVSAGMASATSMFEFWVGRTRRSPIPVPGVRHASACRYKNEVPDGSRRSARRTHFPPREVSQQSTMLPIPMKSLVQRLKAPLAQAETSPECDRAILRQP